MYLHTIVIDALSGHGIDLFISKLEVLERLTASLRENIRMATGLVLRDLQTIVSTNLELTSEAIKQWLEKNMGTLDALNRQDGGGSGAVLHKARRRPTDSIEERIRAVSGSPEATFAQTRNLLQTIVDAWIEAKLKLEEVTGG